MPRNPSIALAWHPRWLGPWPDVCILSEGRGPYCFDPGTAGGITQSTFTFSWLDELRLIRWRSSLRRTLRGSGSTGRLRRWSRGLGGGPQATRSVVPRSSAFSPAASLPFPLSVIDGAHRSSPRPRPCLAGAKIMKPTHKRATAGEIVSVLFPHPHAVTHLLGQLLLGAACLLGRCLLPSSAFSSSYAFSAFFRRTHALWHQPGLPIMD
jgi:hypothetical protein